MDLTTIEATARIVGLHHWPDASPERAYLANSHRHLFVARAEVTVGHDNRDVEFHDLGNDLEHALAEQNDGLVGGVQGDSMYDFGARSCEHLARAVVVQLQAKGYNVVQVSVSEDDEFTARVMPGVELVGGHVEAPAGIAGNRSGGTPGGGLRIGEPARVPGAESLS